MSFEDNKTEMPDTTYNEYENPRSTNGSNIDRNNDSERANNTELTQIIRNTRSSASRAVLFALALMATMPGCQFGPDRTGQSIEISDSSEANKELECLRRDFERAIHMRNSEDRNIRMTELISKRNILLEEHNIPEGTEKWYKAFGSQEPDHLRTEVNYDCKKPHCRVVSPKEAGPDMEGFSCKDRI